MESQFRGKAKSAFKIFNRLRDQKNFSNFSTMSMAFGQSEKHRQLLYCDLQMGPVLVCGKERRDL